MNQETTLTQVFTHEKLGQLRTVSINGKVWFVEVDVCRILDLKNPRQVIKRLKADEKMKLDMNGVTNTVTNMDGIADAIRGGWTKADEKMKLDMNGVTNTVGISDGQSDAIRGGWTNTEVNLINEPGLYRLIFMSRKPQAEEFQHWIYHNVIPVAVRNPGMFENAPKFVTNNAPPTVIYTNGFNNEVSAHWEKIKKAEAIISLAKLIHESDWKDYLLHEATILLTGKDFTPEFSWNIPTS